MYNTRHSYNNSICILKTHLHVNYSNKKHSTKNRLN